MSTGLEIVATALFFSFVTCCIVSGMLQVLAWLRHAREGAPVTFRALVEPEPYFDDVGVRQIRLARRLLMLGASAYVVYVVATVAAA